MISAMLQELAKLITTKNIGFVVLLILTCLSGYVAWDMIKSVMQDNRELVKSLDKVNDNLEDILGVLKVHEKSHEKVN